MSSPQVEARPRLSLALSSPVSNTFSCYLLCLTRSLYSQIMVTLLEVCCYGYHFSFTYYHQQLCDSLLFLFGGPAAWGFSTAAVNFTSKSFFCFSEECERTVLVWL